MFGKLNWFLLMMYACTFTYCQTGSFVIFDSFLSFLNMGTDALALVSALIQGTAYKSPL